MEFVILGKFLNSSQSVLKVSDFPPQVSKEKCGEDAVVSGSHSSSDFVATFSRCELCPCPRCRILASPRPGELCARCQKVVAKMSTDMNK